jgi:indole-3-glycerol phosphate synthase
MSTILDEIVASKRREVAEQQGRAPLTELERRLSEAPPVRDFRAALESPLTPTPLPPGERETKIIAEVKKASPSAGVIRTDFDPVVIAETYASHGAACISVLTDAPYFQGNIEYLRRIRARVAPPLLRKDFLIDRYQVVEARVAGADAVLLIAEVLSGPELPALLRQTQELGMQALVELYDAENLPRVIDSGAQMIGVNNRNLRTFVTRLEHTLELAGRVPADRCLVSESGIRNRADILRLQAAGVRAVLIGETLMAAADIGRKLDELRGVQ